MFGSISSVLQEDKKLKYVHGDNLYHSGVPKLCSLYITYINHITDLMRASQPSNFGDAIFYIGTISPFDEGEEEFDSDRPLP